MKIPEKTIQDIIDLALKEDTGGGDVTSDVLISPDMTAEGSLLAKAEGVLAGGEVARRVFTSVDPSLHVEIFIKDGTVLKPGDIIGSVSGKAAGIFKAERVALNFIQKLSGIATETSKYVAETRSTRVTVIDTRKTTPGLRLLEKYAVRMGGGQNHRFNLSDGILIKDNHLAALRSQGMCIKDIVRRAKQNAPTGLKVEVEVTSEDEAREASEAGADIIMLDNMNPDEIRRAKRVISDDIKIEASGGITLENIRSIAETGVDYISIGALTHSSKALDISLEIEPQAFKTS